MTLKQYQEQFPGAEYISDEYRQNMSIGNSGRDFSNRKKYWDFYSEEQKEEYRKQFRGENNPFFGQRNI